MTLRIAFFVPVPDRTIVKRVGFYAQDISAFEQLGFEVIIACSWRELIRVRADVYYAWWWTWAFIPIAIAKLRRRPIIVTGTFDYDTAAAWEKSYQRRPVWERLLMRFGLKYSDLNIFLSRFEFDSVTQHFNYSRAIYAPLTVDTEQYGAAVVDREPELVFTLAWLQRANFYRKSIPEIIRSIPLVQEVLPSVRFVIAGEKGDGWEELDELARSLGVEDVVEFCGTISEDAKIELMGKCGVYLSPSRYEGFGLAILEAMSSRAPVVSSPVGAVTEVVGGSGVLIDGSSPSEISRAILDILGNPDLARSMGEAARVRVTSEYEFSRRVRDLSSAVVSVRRPS